MDKNAKYIQQSVQHTKKIQNVSFNNMEQRGTRKMQKILIFFSKRFGQFNFLLYFCSRYKSIKSY